MRRGTVYAMSRKHAKRLIQSETYLFQVYCRVALLVFDASFMDAVNSRVYRYTLCTMFVVVRFLTDLEKERVHILTVYALYVCS